LEKNWQYRSTIKSRPFFFIETKKLSALILEGLNDYEIREEVVENNIFQTKNISRRKEIASTILRRLHQLDTFLQKNLTNNTVETSKAIVLYSIIKTDRLFYEFMFEVIYEKLLIQDLMLKDSEIDTYFNNKKGQSEVVGGWKDYTIYKLKQVYKRILREAGLLHNDNNNLKITVPMIDPNVISHIK